MDSPKLNETSILKFPSIDYRTCIQGQWKNRPTMSHLRPLFSCPSFLCKACPWHQFCNRWRTFPIFSFVWIPNHGQFQDCELSHVQLLYQSLVLLRVRGLHAHIHWQTACFLECITKVIYRKKCHCTGFIGSNWKGIPNTLRCLIIGWLHQYLVSQDIVN